MIFSQGIDEYIFTIGMLVSFFGVVISLIVIRKEIIDTFKKIGIKRMHLIFAFLIMVLFLIIELFVVKTTQQLFFDDVIYQGGAQMLLHTGQAWMCNYGSPTNCISGQIFHEPIGTSFLLAIGFLFFGVNRYVAFYEFIIIGAIAIVALFAAASVLFKKPIYALFSELLFALSPLLLVWAAPTNSDIVMMLYSIITFFALLLLIEKKSIWTWAFMLFSFSALTYTKIDALMYLPIFFVVYVALSKKPLIPTLKKYVLHIKKIFKINIDLRYFILIILFIIGIVPSLIYFSSQYNNGYGFNNTQIANSCSKYNTQLHVTAALDLANFNANVCANVLFWFNSYSTMNGYPIMQPLFFTVLGIIGAALMFLKNRRELFALGIWFIIVFLIYTSFYAGSILYGVDWRFFLALIPLASLFGGFAIGRILEIKHIQKNTFVIYATFIVIIILIFYSTLSMYNNLAISPSHITQANSARFYENFIYNNSNKIPNDCLVFSFDPTLFNINNKSSLQFSYLSNINETEYNSYMNDNKCLVIDYGFWCYTPEGSSMCQSALNEFNTTILAMATDNYTTQRFSIYQINKFN
ncbi:MAG: glycosyltransferase family 39 protein [Candidatus Marsarchaeota archaeon]|nr:glycosyltransferase family 39 protein [Candidatus Marsarchaeota archaeon]